MYKPILGILLGDSAGVGAELIAKVSASNFLNENCKPILIGDIRIFRRALDIIKADIEIQVIDDVAEINWGKGLPFLDQKNQDPKNEVFGKLSATSGKASMEMLKNGIALWKSGKIDGYVFGPLNKSAMHEAGLKFESEHHYIANLLGHTEPFGEINVTNGLYTTRTTSHIPIKAVSDNLTLKSIGRAIRLSYNTLKNAGVENPIIGIAGLNPHNGENGECGREEIDVIEPAIKEARKMGIDARGPYPSDIVFHKALVKQEFHSVVTMYHDQGQIALKLIGFEGGITVAGGFPIPIVTCGHGTAYDIAGTGEVSTASFENAIIQCAKMAYVNRE
ncbi:MAG: 4-hydroxythreonine-4-phosphate dehydrogenase PdxA [Lachnospirales bacterium]